MKSIVGWGIAFMLIWTAAIVASSCGGSPCDRSAPSQSAAPGITYYDCSGASPRVRVVTIDRDRANTELWLLDDPVSRPVAAPQLMNLRSVQTFSRSLGYHALVAVNGYNWSGQDGYADGDQGTPDTTTYETGLPMTANASRCPGFPDPCPEAWLGASGGLDVKRVPGDQVTDPANSRYQYNLYGTNSSVLGKNGTECYSDSASSHWSIIGYSPTQIVLLVNQDNNTQQELCSTLTNFGVTDAVRNDGNPSAQMDLPGLNLSFDFGKHPLYDTRRVAYAVGVVELFPAQVTNPGFEEPALSAGEAWRRLSSLSGWDGPVDLHSGWDLTATGNQIVDLNQDGPGFIHAQLPTPADTYCLLQFAHGLNYHCVASASFDVVIDGARAGSFTSTVEAGCEPRGCLKEERVRFKASGNTTDLRFESTSPGCGAATIDDVRLSCTSP